MGHKKRTVVASRSKPSQAAPATDGGPSSVGTNETLDSSLIKQQKLKLSKIKAIEVEPAIKLECERALTALGRGNHTKALRLMKDLCAKNDKNSANSALVHRVQGTVCVKVAALFEDPNAKQRHLRNAIESARKAVSLSPDSVEFLHFYANLMFETAKDGKEYNDVIEECQCALAIENPVDPAKESLHVEGHQKISTRAARIAHVQSELRSLIEKSTIAILTTCMKSINGEDKLRLYHISTPTEDPMEVTLVQARRPNEIKKATKTPEERRKEIEVRVAAARLLQQKSESPQSRNDSDKTLGPSSGSGQRAGERRKNARKNSFCAEIKDSVRCYWNSMTLEMKKGLLKLKISDIKAHFSSSKDTQAHDVLSEALSYAETNKGLWNSWVCCNCGNKFADSESFMQHVRQEHISSQLPDLKSILPQSIEDEWTDMIFNCPWKPLDVNAAVEMLEKQSNHQTPNFVDESDSRNDTDECKDCFTDSYDSEDAWDSSPDNRKLGDKLSDNMWRECYENPGCRSTFLPDSWPLSNDTERATLLEKISSKFKSLIQHNYLATIHFSKVRQFAVDELDSLASGSQLLNYGVGQTLVCICFLGAQKLKKVDKLLQELAHSCEVGKHSDDSDSTTPQAAGITAKVVLDEYESCLLLDGCFLLPCKVPPTICHDAVTADDVPHENGVVLDADALLSWIFTGSTIGEQLALWMRKREEKAHQAVEILKTIEKEYNHLKRLYEDKCALSSYEDALQAVEDICLEEDKRRECVTEVMSHRSYESLLRKQRKEVCSKFECDVICFALKKAETFKLKHFGFEETYSGLNSHLWDLESGIEEDWRKKDYLRRQLDSCIEDAIQEYRKQWSNEVSKVDAKVIQNVTGLQQLNVKLEAACAHDYQSILVPLVKSFVQARLEDVAEKDATEKSDAAREAFLAELDLEKAKGEKKKNKDHRKTKDLKAPGSNEPQLFHQETAGDGDDRVSDTIVAGSGVDVNQEEEEELRRRKLKIEAEARKLEETLEYQRQVENEAKQRHLAQQQHKKTAIPISDKKEAVGSPDGFPNGVIREDVVSLSDWQTGRRGKCQKNSTQLVDGKYQPLPSKKGTVKAGQVNLKDSFLDNACLENARQLCSQEDEDEQFQADLKRAVLQSLGTGLKNEVGEYNCFLNVIIQSLWHIGRFREEFLRRSTGHVHVGDPCVICALHDIFVALSTASTDLKTEAVAPTSLRIGLSNLYPDSNFFQEGQMNDASEVLGVIFDCLHRSFTSGFGASESELVESSGIGSWDCASKACVAHSLFGMDIFERMNCYNCGLESRRMKYTSFFHNINATALRTMKVMNPQSSFDELLNLVEKNDQFTCDPEAGGCGRLNYIHHILSTPPHVLTTVLGWQNTCENIVDISATLVALATDIDIGVPYRGLDPKNIHRLISVVCYYGKHYHCFAYNRDGQFWVMYDDKTVKVIGGWDDVISTCERGHLQPQVLFFEAVN